LLIGNNVELGDSEAKPPGFDGLSAARGDYGDR